MSSNIIQPLQQPNNSNNEKQSKAYWDDITTNVFIKASVIETLAGNRPNSHFSKIGMEKCDKILQRFVTKKLSISAT